jgi:hypothetical protein
MKNEKIYKLKISAILPFQFFIVSLITFYLGNIKHTHVNAEQLLIISIVLFFSFAMLIYALLPNNIENGSQYKKFAAGVIIGLSICTWFQSQIFTWNLGPLDGRGIKWGDWKNHANIEIAFWLTVPLIVGWLAKNRNKIANDISNLSILIGILSLASSLAISLPLNDKKIATNNPFEFHPEKNIIIIMLDTFQSDYFEKINKEYPAETRFLEDFTFYRNTISSYPTTRGSLPTIFTGKEYLNTEPIEPYLDKLFSQQSIQKAVSEKELNYSVVSLPTYAGDATTISDHIQIDNNYALGILLDYSLFRSTPTQIKKYIYNDGAWLNARLINKSLPPGFHGLDVLFLQIFNKEAKVDQFDRNKGKLTFYHFMTPHMPIQVNQNLEYDPQLAGREGYEKQARGALLIARQITEKLKNLNIYEKSEIFVISDHGARMPMVAEFPAGNKFIEINSDIQASSLALLLHKKPNANNKALIVDDSDLYLKDLPCLFTHIQLNKDFECGKLMQVLNGENRERLYYYYDWSEKYWDWRSEFMPTIFNYRLNGHAYDQSAWSKPDKTFSKDGIELIKNHKIQRNTVIKFKDTENNEWMPKFGWHAQENTHMWNDGEFSGIRLYFDQTDLKNVILKFNLFGLKHDNAEFQKVYLQSNNKRVAEWLVSDPGTFTALIDKKLINTEGKLDLTFQVSAPRAPCSFSQSTDCRVLGIAINELKIELDEKIKN